MSPKFYNLLWVAFAVAAGVLFVAGVFTMLTLVVFGFIAFGLVWVGMICVLPGTVGHEAVAVKQPATPKSTESKSYGKPAHAFRSYRSA
ncbi:MAG: hypothetical protein ABL999_10695 [Pyrinomonadaceae bacterium]